MSAIGKARRPHMAGPACRHSCYGLPPAAAATVHLGHTQLCGQQAPERFCLLVWAGLRWPLGSRGCPARRGPEKQRWSRAGTAKMRWQHRPAIAWRSGAQGHEGRAQGQACWEQLKLKGRAREGAFYGTAGQQKGEDGLKRGPCLPLPPSLRAGSAPAARQPRSAR